FLYFCWCHWMSIVSVTTLAFIIAVVHLARVTPLYTATTQVLLEPPAKAPTETGSTDYYSFGDFAFIENQLAIIKSDPLLRRDVVKERLAGPPPSAKEPQTQVSSQGSPTSAEDKSILDAGNNPRGALTVSPGGKAQVLNLSTSLTDPAPAPHLTNTD